ncbi:MAG: hypothetical protein RR955_00415 [Raoultibacter sp.]
MHTLFEREDHTWIWEQKPFKATVFRNDDKTYSWSMGIDGKEQEGSVEFFVAPEDAMHNCVRSCADLVSELLAAKAAQ